MINQNIFFVGEIIDQVLVIATLNIKNKLRRY